MKMSTVGTIVGGIGGWIIIDSVIPFAGTITKAAGAVFGMGAGFTAGVAADAAVQDIQSDIKQLLLERKLQQAQLTEFAAGKKATAKA